jgi:hypothetical protein
MNDTKLNEEVNEQIAYDNYKKRLKPLYLLIKLDVDEEVVFNYDQAAKYATNFCNNMEFELIDHCLEEEENPCLYIGGEEDNKPLFHIT